MKHALVLAYVNRIRKKLSKKPIKRLPKGEMGVPSRCSIANGIGNDVLVCLGQKLVFTTRQVFILPDECVRFGQNFDDGKYPELVRK